MNDMIFFKSTAVVKCDQIQYKLHQTQPSTRTVLLATLLVINTWEHTYHNCLTWHCLNSCFNIYTVFLSLHAFPNAYPRLQGITTSCPEVSSRCYSPTSKFSLLTLSTPLLCLVVGGIDWFMCSQLTDEEAPLFSSFCFSAVQLNLMVRSSLFTHRSMLIDAVMPISVWYPFQQSGEQIEKETHSTSRIPGKTWTLVHVTSTYAPLTQSHGSISSHKNQRQTSWVVKESQIRQWPPSIFAIDFSPLQERRNKHKILRKILNSSL